MKYFIFLVVPALFYSGNAFEHYPESIMEIKNPSELRITILYDNYLYDNYLYDNYLYDNSFRNSWGFSCLLEGMGKTI